MRHHWTIPIMPTCLPMFTLYTAVYSYTVYTLHSCVQLMSLINRQQ